MRTCIYKPTEYQVKNFVATDDVRTRAEVNQQTVDEYTEALKAKAKFPPIDAYQCNKIGKFVVMAGEHRLLAHIAAGRDKIEARIHYHIKNAAQALEFGTKANRQHGLRPSLRDRQHALGQWLRHHRLFNKSDRVIASAVGVDHKTVAALRAKLVEAGEIPKCQKRVGKDGKQYSATKNVASTVGSQYDEATVSAAKKLGVSPEAVNKASAILHSGRNDVIDAVTSGQMDLDEAMGKIVDADEVDHGEHHHDGVDDVLVDDEPSLDTTLGDEIASRVMRVRLALKDVADEHLAAVLAAVRAELDRIEERAAQECAV
jgi:uncharacterized ParB-like nuclease family protein